MDDCLSAARKQYAGNFGASLDAPLKDMGVCLGSTIRAVYAPIEETLYLRTLFDLFELQSRKFMKCCMLGYSEDEIQNILGISNEETESLIKEIKRKWKEYDPGRFK